MTESKRRKGTAVHMARLYISGHELQDKKCLYMSYMFICFVVVFFLFLFVFFNPGSFILFAQNCSRVPVLSLSPS